MIWHRQKNVGTFDLLIEDLGPDGLEVECKSISEDKGRRIHQIDALEFLGEMRGNLAAVTQNLRSGFAVVLTVPDRFPRDADNRVALAKEVVARIVAESGATLDGGETVRIEPFDPATIQAASNMGRDEWRKTIDAVTGTANCGAVIYATPVGGMLIFVMQSAIEDNMLDQVFATLDDSAARQFTGSRGSLFWVGLQGIDATELQSLHDQDNFTGEQPTSLRLAVSNFLHRAPSHIVGVVFNSRTSLFPAFEGSTASGGSTYFFVKEESPFWYASFRNPLRAAGITD